MAIIKEFDELTRSALNIDDEEFSNIKKFARNNLHDKNGKYRPVLVLKNDKLYAQNYVGILETKKGSVIEILPKIDFAKDIEDVKMIFLNMLRTWRSTQLAQLNQANIRSLRHFNMLDIFIHLFLNDLILLTKRGLARHYRSVENNLPVLKGRIQFQKHISTNIVDRSRFYVEYDEFSANRPANRLIHLTIDKLRLQTKQSKNLQLLDQLKVYFVEVPKSINVFDDWKKHRVDRSMQHYNTVMQWIELFLFGHGLTTFSGKHLNQSLLFPMEQIFEDYVAHAFKKYWSNYDVITQGPRKSLAKIEQQEVFMMKPDISLLISKTNIPKIILDSKWKRINESKDKYNNKHGISQKDMYQLFAYGKIYRSNPVGLIFPKTDDFKSTLNYEYEDEKLNLFCFPFDVTKPKESVEEILEQLA